MIRSRGGSVARREDEEFSDAKRSRGPPGRKMTEIEMTPEVLLQRARDGDDAARGRLLELYRNYLRVLARAMIGQALQARLDASDLVQETYLKAHREFGQFLGGGERELVGWLRQILVRTLANQAKHHRALGRDVRRQESLEAALDRSRGLPTRFRARADVRPSRCGPGGRPRPPGGCAAREELAGPFAIQPLGSVRSPTQIIFRGRGRIARRWCLVPGSPFVAEWLERAARPRQPSPRPLGLSAMSRTGSRFDRNSNPGS